MTTKIKTKSVEKMDVAVGLGLFHNDGWGKEV